MYDTPRRVEQNKNLEEPDPTAGCADMTGAVKKLAPGNKEKILEEPDYVNMSGAKAKALSAAEGEGSKFLNESHPLAGYSLQKIIGKGRFCTVFLANDVREKRLCAIKMWLNSDILEGKKNLQLFQEREILCLLKEKAKETAPFFIEIYASFLHQERLTFVLSYAPNGTMRSYLNKIGRFSINLARFYAAEILLALEYMHELGIIHRNMTTKSILLDERMHIKISSFETASILTGNERGRLRSKKTKTRSWNLFYVPLHELAAQNSECSRSGDLWGFGSVLYEMVSGLTPFLCKGDGIIIKNVLHLRYYYPVVFCAEARDLVEKLLVVCPAWKRLGAYDYGTYTSIRNHAFFKGVEFERLYLKNPMIFTDFSSCSQSRLLPSAQPLVYELGFTSLTPFQKEKKLFEQRRNMPNLDFLYKGLHILKYGTMDTGEKLFAGKILFPQKRVILLTSGPHLYLADHTGGAIVEEICWGPDLRVKHRNFKVFMVRTLNKIYYFKDSENTALRWCAAIEEVHKHTYQML